MKILGSVSLFRFSLQLNAPKIEHAHGGAFSKSGQIPERTPFFVDGVLSRKIGTGSALSKTPSLRTGATEPAAAPPFVRPHPATIALVLRADEGDTWLRVTPGLPPAFR